MNKNLVISGIVGGVIGSLLTALIVSPITAQRDKFGTIQCDQLEVVDADGVVGVVLSIGEHGGRIDVVKDDISKVVLHITEHGGVAAVRDNDGKLGVSLFNDEYGNGAVSTWDKNSTPR